MPISDDSLRDKVQLLADRMENRDSEVSALMSIVIQTNKEVSHNLVKLTEVVSNVSTLEKVQEQQQETISAMQVQVSKNETDIKLTLQDKQHIKESLEEIKQNQKDAQGVVMKIFAGIVTVAVIGGITARFVG